MHVLVLLFGFVMALSNWEVRGQILRFRICPFTPFVTVNFLAIAHGNWQVKLRKHIIEIAEN